MFVVVISKAFGCSINGRSNNSILATFGVYNVNLENDKIERTKKKVYSERKKRKKGK